METFYVKINWSLSPNFRTQPSYVQAISNPAFEWIAYMIFSFITFSELYGGMRRRLKQVLEVGSFVSGSLQSILTTVNKGYNDPNPIKGALGHDVTNLSILDRSSSFMPFSTSSQNHLTWIVLEEKPFLYVECLTRSFTSKLLDAPEISMFSSLSLNIANQFKGIHSLKPLTNASDCGLIR